MSESHCAMQLCMSSMANLKWKKAKEKTKMSESLSFLAQSRLWDCSENLFWGPLLQLWLAWHLQLVLHTTCSDLCVSAFGCVASRSRHSELWSGSVTWSGQWRAVIWTKSGHSRLTQVHFGVIFLWMWQQQSSESKILDMRTRLCGWMPCTDSIFEFKEQAKTPSLGVQRPSNFLMFFGTSTVDMEVRWLSIKATICPHLVFVCQCNWLASTNGESWFDFQHWWWRGRRWHDQSHWKLAVQFHWHDDESSGGWQVATNASFPCEFVSSKMTRFCCVQPNSGCVLFPIVGRAYSMLIWREPLRHHFVTMMTTKRQLLLFSPTCHILHSFLERLLEKKQ